MLIMRISICLLFCLLASPFGLIAQEKQELNVFYLEEFPYAFEEEGKLKGIEIDIIYAFQDWLKAEKNIDLNLEFTAGETFESVYKSALQDEHNVSCASITITKERKSEVKFSPPYMKNASVLVTSQSIPTLRNYNDIKTVFDGMVAVVRKGTTHEEELKEIKAFHYPDMIVKYVDTKEEAEKLLSTEDSKYYAVIDLVTFWRWRTRDEVPVKMHNIATERNEKFAFAFNNESSLADLFAEFFKSGFGFTSTEDYISILDKYLGPEVRDDVRMK